MMIRTALLVLLAATALTAAAPHFSFGLPNVFECTKTLAPTKAEEAAAKTYVDTCLANLPSIAELIANQLEGKRKRRSTRWLSWWTTTPAPSDSWDLTPEEVFGMLLGKLEALKELKICVFSQAGLLTDELKFDMIAFVTQILAKVKGTVVETFTQAAIDKCPAVEDFNVATYLKCVLFNCITEGIKSG